jgi:predicted AAA+ superfamily ATPase
MNAYNAYSESFADISYWRLAGGTEVDFIINGMEIAIEAKAAENITGKHLKGLRSIKEDHPNIKRRLVICCERRQRVTDDGIEILPTERFIEMLWQGYIW